MSQVPELIERALAVAGSQAELARLLRVAAPNITVWKIQSKQIAPQMGLFCLLVFCNGYGLHNG